MEEKPEAEAPSASHEGELNDKADGGDLHPHAPHTQTKSEYPSPLYRPVEAPTNRHPAALRGSLTRRREEAHHGQPAGPSRSPLPIPRAPQEGYGLSRRTPR